MIVNPPEDSVFLIEGDVVDVFMFSVISKDECKLPHWILVINEGARCMDINFWPRVWISFDHYDNNFPINLDTLEPYNEHNKFDKLSKNKKKLVLNALPFIKENQDTLIAHWNGEIWDNHLHDIIHKRITLEEAIKDVESHNKNK